MVRLLLLAAIHAAFFLFSYLTFAQNDSVFVNNALKPETGKVQINYKKQHVMVSGVNGKHLVPFKDITAIKMGNGSYYVNKIRDNKAALQTLLVKGRYSLLFDNQTKAFYIEKNNSLLVISQPHMQRALPLIFGDAILASFYAKFKIKPLYSAAYLSKLTTYANQTEGQESIKFTENLNQFKTSIHLGPYLGYAVNRTAFDLYSDYVKGRLVYRKTDYYTTYSIPVGLRLDLNLSRRIGIGLAAYMNRIREKEINLANTGFHTAVEGELPLDRKKYPLDLTMTGFSFTSFNLDLALNVQLMRNYRSKLKPYVFVGPTIAWLTRNELKHSAGYKETPDSDTTYYSRWSKLNKHPYMVGFNAGAGANYAVNNRLSVGVLAKFVGGIYPKINDSSYTSKKQNNTSASDDSFRVFRSYLVDHTYDQYVRMFSIGFSATYKL